MSEYYEVHCASCGGIQLDESGEPEQFGFDQWRFHIEKCQYCGSKENGDYGLMSILIEEVV
tara:strand:- start:689 stop:871 length:183 start_codon:yes stop_codon:yes gene_type:complete